jgi:alpha-D-ribose 1-methylphosphonate 5-triphosphate synthase subunit PhnG
MTAAHPADDPQAARQHWLGVLAHAPRALLAERLGDVMALPFDTLRAPEIGLVMLRARVAQQGDRFNLGEATVTRCVLRHQDAGGRATVGVGYVLGRDMERVGWMARLDALLQQPHWRARLMADVIAPLAAAIAYQRADEQQRTTASRVQFYTLQSEGLT